MNKNVAFKGVFKNIFRNYLVALCILLLVIITIIVEPNFLNISNLMNIIRQFGPLSLISLGMTFVIMAGYLDLSVAGMLSLVAVVTVSMIGPLGQVGALLLGILLGTAMGFINGSIILSVNANRSSEALFITFGMGMVYSAIALIYTGGATQKLKEGQGLYDMIGKGGWGILSVSFLIFLFCLIVLYIFQSKTYLGRAIILTGGNPVSSQLSGIPVKKSIVVIYMISGLMTAVGAIVLFSRVTTASPSIGKTFDINAITAVIIGGSSLKGGNGSVLRTVLGVALVTLMSNCLNFLGLSSYMQNVIKGMIMMLAIWLDNRKAQIGG